MSRYALSPAAVEDLREIAKWYAERSGSATVAERVVKRIAEACELIAHTPGEVGRERPELGREVRSYAVPPYVVFHRSRGERVKILRILHEGRDLDAQRIE